MHPAIYIEARIGKTLRWATDRKHLVQRRRRESEKHILLGLDVDEGALVFRRAERIEPQRPTRKRFGLCMKIVDCTQYPITRRSRIAHERVDMALEECAVIVGDQI